MNKQNEKGSEILSLIIGGLVLVLIYYTFGNNDDETALSEITSSYADFTANHKNIDLLRVFETTPNNYVVELKVDGTVEVTKESNTKEKNIVLTRRWSRLVCTNEVSTIYKKYEIGFFTVKQIDQFGEQKSIAICS